MRCYIRAGFRWCATAILIVLVAHAANGQVTVYTDRTLFTAALVGPTHTDDFESYALGPIPPGGVRGDFQYTFDPTVTQPAIVPGGSGGQALGGSPFDVFVGGDSVTLTAGAGSSLDAFGADFLYAPSFQPIPDGTYRIGIGDGSAAGQFAGSPGSIDPGGGTFFLGLIVAPGFEFTSIELTSVQLDPAFVVPAYQVDNLIYAGRITPAGVPEPASPCAAAACGLLLAFAARRAQSRVFSRLLRRSRT